MGKMAVSSGKVKALAFNRLELASMVLAVDRALDVGADSNGADNFPSRGDHLVLKRLSRRLWAALGVRDGQDSRA